MAQLHCPITSPSTALSAPIFSRMIFKYSLSGITSEEDFNTSRFFASIGFYKTLYFPDILFRFDFGYIYSTESSEDFTFESGVNYEKESEKSATVKVALDAVKPALASSEIYVTLVLATDDTRSYAEEDSGAQLGPGFRTEIDPGASIDIGGSFKDGDVSEYGLHAMLTMELQHPHPPATASAGRPGQLPAIIALVVYSLSSRIGSQDR